MKLVVNHYEISVYEDLLTDDLPRLIHVGNNLIVGESLKSDATTIVRIQSSLTFDITTITIHHYRFANPFISVDSENNKILLGYNQELIYYDLNTTSIINKSSLYSLAIAAFFVNEKIVAICETDIFILDTNGKIVDYIKLDDLIESYCLSGNEIIYTAGNNRCTINL